VWKGQKNCNCLSAASSPWAQHKKKGRKLFEQVRAPRNPIPRERENPHFSLLVESRKKCQIALSSSGFILFSGAEDHSM
jgi:hypothetical protein